MKRWLAILFLASLCAAQVKVPPQSLTAANQCATIGISGMSLVAFQVTGTFSQTLQPQVVLQGQSAQNVQVTPLDAAGNFGLPAQTVTGTGMYTISISPYDTFQLCVTNFVSGTAVIYMNATANPGTGSTLGLVTTRSDAGSPFSCIITLSTNTTTQCQAAPSAGLRNYVQNYQIFTTSAGTTETVTLDYGTGANCGSGTTAITPTFATTASTTAPQLTVSLTGSGIVPPTGNAICVAQAGTTAGNVTVLITGFVAP